MTEEWKRCMDNGKVIGVIFIDFKKAFDCVPHSVLMRKLQAIGVCGEAFDIVKSYLEERKQFTVVNNQNSPLEQVTTGVPQGSLLGPDLFTTTANDLPENIPSGNSFCLN